ncbi:hypothetical protein GALMADRAFT_873658 [Galerina marginata CBS 339.88]|uniref:F-box domain-containing protein n=1 Tax=Galerina marginata (strain CBS 339.88) TaxID=685588 RepID=A0A067TLF7_GALM3|nr:hypothetical protein GALMADRAFT_873658 [Galerina marginata CBS 339.88]
MQPELPVELLDYIFTFMRDDHPSLKACTGVNQAFSEIVEKHLYYELSLYNIDSLNTRGELRPAQLLKLFTDQPQLASHVRSLRIIISGLAFLQWFVTRTMNEDDIGRIFPRISHLSRISLAGRRNSLISWGRLQDDFQTSFVEILRTRSLVDVAIYDMDNFPLSLLDNCKSLKHLELSGSFSSKADDAAETSISNSTNPVRAQLTSLSLRYWSSSVGQILGWLQSESSPHIGTLRSLKMTLQHVEYGSVVPAIFAACSTSLKELELNPGQEVNTRYNLSGEIIPSHATLHQIVDLSTIPNLNRLTIVTHLGSVEDFWISSSGEDTVETCIYTTPFSWILRLMATLSRLRSNSLEYVVLDLSFSMNRRSLEMVNLGHLTSAFNLKLLPSLRNVKLRATFIRTSTVDLRIFMQVLQTNPHLSPLIASGLWTLTAKEYQA